MICPVYLYFNKTFDSHSWYLCKLEKEVEKGLKVLRNRFESHTQEQILVNMDWGILTVFEPHIFISHLYKKKSKAEKSAGVG